jgi:transcriptional regulator with XRE-family HTH domain
MKTFFSDRLKAARGSRSQRDFAAFLGVKQTTYSRWELAQTEPSFDGLMNICGRLGVTADWLLGLSDARGLGVSVQNHDGAVAVDHSKVEVAHPSASADVARLLGIIESQQKVIARLAGVEKDA